MIETDVYGGTLNLQEERLCLDFANTVEWHASDQPEEHLKSYPDLVAWAERVGILTNDEARRLARAASHRPAEATEVLRQAVELREAIYHILSAIAAGVSPESSELTILNTWLSAGGGRWRVAQTGAGFAWRWLGQGETLDWLLWPVAQSAAELLVSQELERVKMCADDRGCGWLFLDTSRNRSRRWCSMQSCGNRAKVRRHRRKH